MANFFFGSAKVAWSTTICLAAVLLSRELRNPMGTTCVLSAQDRGQAEKALEREAELLRAKADSLTTGLNAVLTTMPSELEKVKNLTKLLSLKAQEDATTLQKLEAEYDVEAALKDAEDAANDARAAVREVRQRPDLAMQLDALEAQSRKAMATALEDMKAANKKRIDDVAHQAAADAKKAVDKLLLVMNPTTTTTPSQVDCDAGELAKLTDAAAKKYLEGDRVGLFDFALSSAGGKVVKHLTSPPYTPPNRYIPTALWHAVGRDAGVGRPSDAITNRVNFGSCFAFSGSRGRLVVRLTTSITPASFSLEHIHSSLCNPVHNTNCSSAPRDFHVFGFNSSDHKGGSFLSSLQLSDPVPLEDAVFLGKFRYDARAPDMPTLQRFETTTDSLFDTIALDVLSNHGHPDYTCIYRFRVHGSPPAVG